MRAMIEAYARNLAPATSGPDTSALAGMEVDVTPKDGGDLVTYEGVFLQRHVAACGQLPAVGDVFWGHLPGLPAHVAKFDLGKIAAVRRKAPSAS